MMPAGSLESSTTQGRAWLRGAVFPFLVTRAMLVAIACYARQLSPLKTPEIHYRTSIWLLDVWGRWDAGWYLDIARNGYNVAAPLSSMQQNIAFYPLYPLSIRALAAVFPAAIDRSVAVLAAGVVLSNAAALGAILLLHRHVRLRFGDATAQRTVWALLAFPTAFFFSCVYTEAFFLLLAVACFDAAWNERWPLAGFAGGLLALCRANGVVATLPLVILALRGARTRPWRDTAGRLAWTLLVPAGLVIWWAWLWYLTGNPAAISQAQGAWARHFTSPWTTLFGVRASELLDPDRVMLFLACIATVLAFLRLSKAEGAFAAGLLAPALCTGVVTSGARFVVVVFPLFTLVGKWSRHRALRYLVLAACLAIQALLFCNWCRYGFVD